MVASTVILSSGILMAWNGFIKLMSTRLLGKVVRTCPIAHRVCTDGLKGLIGQKAF